MIRETTHGKGIVGLLLLLVGLSIVGLPCHADQPTPQAGVLATIPVGELPGSIAVNPGTNRVYVANYVAGTVSVLDGTKHTTVSTVKVEGHPSGIAVNTVTNRIYIGNGLNNLLTIIDGATNTVVATVPVGGKPTHVAVNPVTNRIYLACHQDQTLRIIDGTTNTVLVTSKLNANPRGLAVNTTTDRVYLALDTWIAIYPGMANMLVAHADLNDPCAIAVNSVTNQIYIATKKGFVVVMEGNKYSIVTQVKVGHYPAGIAVNPETCQIYATNLYDNTVSVIDGTTNTISTTVPMGTTRGPQAVAINPTTQQVFIAESDANSVDMIDANAYLTDAERDYARKPHTPTGKVPPTFVEQFADGKLELTRWTLFDRAPGPGSTMDVVGITAADRRLRMRLANTGFHGICTKDAVIDFEDPTPTEITADVDWSKITDGRDIQAGIILCPKYLEKGDYEQKAHNFLELLYHGEFDGRPTTNGHLEVKLRIDILAAPAGSGGGEYSTDEGWLAALRAGKPFPGRKLGLQHLRIRISQTQCAIWENDKVIFQKDFMKLEGLKAPLPWITGYLYFIQYSADHMDGMPARDVYFSNITVRKVADQTAKPALSTKP